MAVDIGGVYDRPPSCSIGVEFHQHQFDRDLTENLYGSSVGNCIAHAPQDNTMTEQLQGGDSGVLMNPPPLEFAKAVNDSIQAFVASTLPPDAKGGIIGVVTTTGVNLAVIQRTGKNSEIVAYVGKKWGAPITAGLQWRQTW